ncbi:DUF4255 domain-containing protein [Anabaena azotica]|uniref:DUF4255 domain-containing protein n=1 Tax=Anabaena azotica FACHB-119 TaxID=947527 RepID=A0ABR8DEC3_9NOST|nr:DUF4255 domain-containing protein [Anabaena azotica]MBD2504725.1 DUF4255 domain-containing protein [Anabaena azotica FACHB-119]
MSNALSIVAVTAVLKDLLENGLVNDSITASVGDVLVTALPPDLIKVGTDERSQLNFFLYHVTQNRNVDWVSPEFRSKHSRTNKTQRSLNPPLALDLHYLLTAYGAKDFQAELLLGYAMQLLHTTTVITSELIENALKNASTSNTTSLISQALAGVSIPKLAEQIGQIKLSPEFLSMEDNSKIWSSLQTHYRPSASYLASMVLIDSHESNQSEGGYTGWSEPTIEQVTTPTQTQSLIFAGSTVIIRGKRLRGDVTRIRLGNREKLLVPEDIKETQISLKLPDDLSAGMQAIQVVHLTMGNGGHRENLTSNVAALIIHPKISVSLHQVIDSSVDLRSVEITVKFHPKLGKTQRVVLLLNEISSLNNLAQSIVVPSPDEDTDVMNIVVNNIKPGNYLVRVQVDGVASQLEMNQTGEYYSPQVTIP